MEYFLQALFWCPSCWRSLGRAMFTVCGLLAIAGVRLQLRVERVERKTGVFIDLDKALESLPIPTSAEGVALAAFGAVLGLALAFAGKWAQKT
ncbi:hypothetical protein [Alicycliphilus denitrificans]|uniref:hypothetical protein n=1 Tax=Alicycliphilus denitrificans TaxID=179636 RepID=UPI00384DBF3D